MAYAHEDPHTCNDAHVYFILVVLWVSRLQVVSSKLSTSRVWFLHVLPRKHLNITQKFLKQGYRFEEPSLGRCWAFVAHWQLPSYHVYFGIYRQLLWTVPAGNCVDKMSLLISDRVRTILPHPILACNFIALISKAEMKYYVTFLTNFYRLSHYHGFCTVVISNILNFLVTVPVLYFIMLLCIQEYTNLCPPDLFKRHFLRKLQL